MAQWKKALIWGVTLLVVSVLVLVGCVLYFKSKRGSKTYSPPATLASYVDE